jgi:hypothetical protein
MRDGGQSFAAVAAVVVAELVSIAAAVVALLNLAVVTAVVVPPMVVALLNLAVVTAVVVASVVVALLNLAVVTAIVVASVVVALLNLAVVTAIVVPPVVVARLGVDAVPARRVVGGGNCRRDEGKAAHGADGAHDGQRGEILLLEDSHRVSLSEVGTQAGCEDRPLHLAKSAVALPIRHWY